MVLESRLPSITSVYRFFLKGFLRASSWYGQLGVLTSFPPPPKKESIAELELRIYSALTTHMFPSFLKNYTALSIVKHFIQAIEFEEK